MTLRRTVLEIVKETLAGVDVAGAMERRLRCSSEHFTVDGILYPLEAVKRVVLVAVGKAAVPMTHALLPILRPGLGEGRSLAGVVAGATTPEHPDLRLRYLPGEHPVPGEGSLAVGAAVLELLERCDESCLVLLLLSGGASSMMEQPLDHSLTLEEVAGFHRRLVLSGLAITPMNVLRKHFSAVKGGRLAVAAERSAFCTLVVSDGPPDAVHVVGSGPSLPDPSTVAQCHKLVLLHATALGFSTKVRDYFLSPSLAETPKATDAAFSRGYCVTLLSSEQLAEGARRSATDAGFYAEVDNHCDEWGFAEAARYLLERVTVLHREHGAACVISVGEISVKVGGYGGAGGRNQHFVLECARLIAERGDAVTVVSVGSDGIDGNSPAAGALADGTTVQRAWAAGQDVAEALARWDSYGLFSAIGDAIVTGPTGNNLRDLRMLLIGHAAQDVQTRKGL